MPNTFRLKRSSVAGKVPTTGDLQLGELALNTTDGKLYTKKSVSGVDSIVELSGGAIADGDKGDITVSASGATWTLDPSGVTAGTYGSSTQIPSLTVDAKGRITSASNNAITVGNGTLTVNTSGTGLSGSGTFSANQSTNGTITITSNATSANTASAIVARDASGNFSAGTITAALNGNATTATTASNVSATADQAIVNQENGNTAAWRGRILSKNSTADRAAFLGTYGGNAGVFAHNNALNAWADLYINTVDGSSGGTVRMPTSLLLGGNQALHAGNYTSYSPSLTGSGASGSWGISITGSSASCTGNAATATSASNLTGGNLTGDYQVTSGVGVRFGHANQSDSNDGFISAGRFASGLNIVGTQTTAGTGRQVRIWGSLIDSGGTSYVLNSGTWGINITGAVNGLTLNQFNTQNARLYTAATGAAGLLGVDSAGNFRYQLYGDGSNYGLLNGAWAGWDLRKANNGELYITVSSVERTVLTSGNYTSYSPSLTGSGASGTWGINITGNSATTSQRTFSNVRTDGINRGSYGTVSIAGTSNGWAGIDFTAAASTLMVTSSIQGFYNNDNAWQWYFQNGVLTAGSVPWSQVTSRPTTLSGYGITDGASVGANGCIQLNNQTISSNYTFTSGQNGVSAGPITIASGVVVTVTSGCSWSVV